MMQGFYLLAMRRARRQRRIALGLCVLTLVMMFFAARAYFTPVTVLAETAPYLAVSEENRLVIYRGGEAVIRTEVDTRSLPAADREALSAGVTLEDAEALAHLLEDYAP